MNAFQKPATPRTDATVTGNSEPSQDEYEDLAFFARNLETELATARAALALAEEQIHHEQNEARKASAILGAAKVPTNGPEGSGKRQDLSVAQRIEKLVAALGQCEEKCKELSEMVETADADAAKHYEDIHKESMAAVEAIRTAEGWGDGVFASVRERIWWIAATRTIDALRSARRDEESWWKEKHDYQARAKSAESALSLLTAKLAQAEEKLRVFNEEYVHQTLLLDEQDKVSALTAAHAKALEDSKRLDWLETHEDHSVFFEPGDPDVGCYSTWVVSKGPIIYAFYEGSLRHTIDAAIASAPATTGKGGEIL